MRLKLVLISALIATVLGLAPAIVVLLFESSASKPTGFLFFAATFLVPGVTTLLASIFVYRHTARRRKLQAILTAIIALVLTILLFLLAPIVTRPKPLHTQPIQPAERVKA